MLFNLLLILGVAVLSLGLRTFQSVTAQKLGVLGVLVTSFLTGWLLTGTWLVGLFCALSWFLLPWLEILTRVRKLTLPMELTLRHKHAPNRENFPALNELTGEIEEENFEHLEDCGWDWADDQQYFRLFYKDADRTHSAICLVEQQGLGFYYLRVSSRSKDGRVWTTWNYPFSSSLKPAPEAKFNRLRGDRSFFELYNSHLDFLRANGIAAAELQTLDPDKLQDDLQNDLRTQISHNVALGLLTKTPSGEVRYSWRGLFFIWFQFVGDLVRLS